MFYPSNGFAHKVDEMDIPLLSKEGRRASAGVVTNVAKPPYNAAKHPLFNKVRCATIYRLLRAFTNHPVRFANFPSLKEGVAKRTNEK